MRLKNFVFIVSAVLFCSVFFQCSEIRAVSPEVLKSLSQKLERLDVEEALAEVKGLLIQEPRNPKLLDLAAQISFYRGDYQESLKLMRSSLELEEEEKRKGFVLFVEGTIGATRSLKRYESPHFSVSLDEKQDGILSGYVLDAMEETFRFMAEHYGFTPRKRSGSRSFRTPKGFTWPPPFRLVTLR